MFAESFQRMNIEDFIIPPDPIASEKWQFGALVTQEIKENGIVLIWVSDFRGSGGDSRQIDFGGVRHALYQLSGGGLEVPVCDLGDLISGATVLDTHYVLQEILSACHYKQTIPVVIGGSTDLSYSLFSALNFHQKNIIFTEVTNALSLSSEGEEITEKNYLSRIFGSKTFSLKQYHLLGYQKHLNDEESVKMIREVDFDIVRLADMMNSPEKTEPFFRRSDLVAFNCDAVESLTAAFSVHPQVNGLNRREICAYMKEAGLSERLKAVGIFNFNFNTLHQSYQQLLAQMIWYLLEGINIRKTHPLEKEFETFWVLVGEKEYAFCREIFSNLWYFGTPDRIEEALPCTRADFEEAKKGYLNPRFLK